MLSLYYSLCVHEEMRTRNRPFISAVKVRIQYKYMIPMEDRLTGEPTKYLPIISLKSQSRQIP